MNIAPSNKSDILKTQYFVLLPHMSGHTTGASVNPIYVILEDCQHTLNAHY